MSGRNSLTGELNSNGYIPQRIRFYSLSMKMVSGQVVFARRRCVIGWQQDMIDLLSKPPQVKGQNIDIWGCPIPDDLIFSRNSQRTGFQGAAEASCLINDNINSRIVTNVGDDCFILGYPLQNYDGLMPPVWKRGSIASETLIGIGGRPIFLVDATTTPGMSGSPIIRRATTITAMNKNIGAVQEFSAYDLIGIYAGRLEGSSLAAINIGYGWYKSMIDHVLEHYKFSPTSAEEIL